MFDIVNKKQIYSWKKTNKCWTFNTKNKQTKTKAFLNAFAHSPPKLSLLSEVPLTYLLLLLLLYLLLSQSIGIWFNCFNAASPFSQPAVLQARGALRRTRSSTIASADI